MLWNIKTVRFQQSGSSLISEVPKWTWIYKPTGILRNCFCKTLQPALWHTHKVVVEALKTQASRSLYRRINLGGQSAPVHLNVWTLLDQYYISIISSVHGFYNTPIIFELHLLIWVWVPYISSPTTPAGWGGQTQQRSGKKTSNFDLLYPLKFVLTQQHLVDLLLSFSDPVLPERAWIHQEEQSVSDIDAEMYWELITTVLSSCKTCLYPAASLGTSRFRQKQYECFLSLHSPHQSVISIHWSALKFLFNYLTAQIINDWQ